MKKKALLSIAVLPLLLSCSGSKTAPKLEDYISSLPLFDSASSVRVLQLTDIHWNFTTDMEKEKKYLSALVKNSNPDVIMTTGDNILTASKENFTSLFDLFESFSELLGHDVYYGVTWGNHDQQGLFDPYFPGRLASSRKHSLYKEIDDDLRGESNYVVSLTKGGQPIWQLYALDTNSLHYSFPSFSYSYDVVSDEQIAWYEQETKLAQSQNPDVKSLMYFHIPLWETAYAYKQFMGGETPGYISSSSGFCYEKTWNLDGLGETPVYAGYKQSALFATAQELGNCQAMFYGHDHKNDFAAKFTLSLDKEPIALCYGLKSGSGLTYNPERIGGNLAVISSEGEVELLRCFQLYEDDYSSLNGYQEEGMLR